VGRSCTVATHAHATTASTIDRNDVEAGLGGTIIENRRTSCLATGASLARAKGHLHMKVNRRVVMTRSRTTLGGGLALVVVTAITTSATAQPRLPGSAGVPTPGRSLAANDQASAIATNPANLGNLVSPELRWTWVRTRDGSPDPGRGHAFDLAVNLPGHSGTGLRLDFVRPNDAATAPASNYTWLTWAFGWAPTRAWSAGFAVRHAYSADPAFDGPTGISLATTSRPSPYLAIAIVGRDLNAPGAHAGPGLGRGVDVAVAVRPLGRRGLEIGVEDQYVDATGAWLPRATVGVDVPYVGRVRADVTTSDPTLSGPLAYAATAGVEIGFGTATVEAGGIFGSQVGGAAGAGFYMGASLTGHHEPGVPEGAYALKIIVEQTPSARKHVALLRQLWSLSQDRELRAVALMLKAEPADSLAHAEELGDAVRMLRASGKKVVCHLEDAQVRALYLCAQADRVVMNPAGVVRFAGLKMQYQFYATLLEKLGIHAQFVRIGAHKSAPESFTRDGASDVARADHIDLLLELESVFYDDFSGGRRIAREKLAETFAHGPFVAREAVDAHLVDGTAFDDELGHVVDEAVGHHVKLRDEPRPPPAPVRFGAQRTVAIVYVEGDMIDGKSRDVPLIGTRLVGSYTIAKTLKEVREDPSIAAVVMRVESPGGSSLAADLMWREAVLTAKVKPLIVSMGTYAASGGYYIASAGDVIYANPLSITGSIGIFYGKADASELFKKIGVTTETYKTSPRADGESMYRPYTDDELRELQLKVQQLYGVFLDRVAQGRHMSRAAVDEVGQGRVWTGRQAQARHLVDRLGGLREALDEARRAARLPYDAPIRELPVPESSLLDVALQIAGVRADTSIEALIPGQFLDVARAVLPFTIYDGDQSLARMELVPIGAP
jgi:protease-4